MLRISTPSCLFYNNCFPWLLFSPVQTSRARTPIFSSHQISKRLIDFRKVLLSPVLAEIPMLMVGMESALSLSGCCFHIRTAQKYYSKKHYHIKTSFFGHSFVNFHNFFFLSKGKYGKIRPLEVFMKKHKSLFFKSATKKTAALGLSGHQHPSACLYSARKRVRQTSSAAAKYTVQS